MAAELQQELGLEAELIADGGGKFDIEVDGSLIFSKHQVGRFPEPGEVVEAIRALE